MTAGPDGDAARLRLVGYNVRDLLDDRDAVAHVVRSCRPDVLCLQEAPRRPGTLGRTVRLARETGLRQVTGGRGSGGTAVLVSPRLDVLTAEAARLPVAHWWTRTRGYALAELRLPGGAELTVVSVHLPLAATERVEHGARVGARVAARVAAQGASRGASGGSRDRPLVVSGDLNEEPGGPSWTSFGDLCRDAVELGGDAVRDAPTYPARSPHRRIDAVLVSPGVRVLALRPAGAEDGLAAADLVAASDHLPLVADLELEGVRTGRTTS